MTHKNSGRSKNTLLLAMAFVVPSIAVADEQYEALKKQVELLQQQLEQVQSTLKQYQQETSASKLEVAELKTNVAQAAVAASEWKNSDSVTHLAGYADVTFSGGNGNEVNNAFTGARFNPIFHYQYKNLVLLEAELEMSADSEGGSEIALEYATIDYLINDHVALVAGKFLSPIGQFRQNLHPSWVNKLPTAPSGFGHDQAAPLSNLGLQARGGFSLSNESIFINYAAFVGNGPILEIEDGEIEAIEAVGRTTNTNDRFIWGGRIGLLPLPRLELGLSTALGKVSSEEESDLLRNYDVFGADFAYQRKNLALRGEYIKQSVGSAIHSEAPDSASWRAWYTQASYQFLSNKWEVALRYSDYDANIDEFDQRQWTMGLNYLFAPNAMIKLGYNFNSNDEGTAADDDNFQLQASYGF